ncbi:hypothetical protein [Planctomicrobium sp. SH527]|uniref:hypothetical protein n=1 Tax=Planctomicrobium sp. SH527 TaxID=3448123 RepID=UPI003F5C9EE5
MRQGTDLQPVLSCSKRRGRSRYVFTRRGISLFEVVLALSIYIGALAAISQILNTGSKAAIRAQLRSQAELYCESQMNLILAGGVPLESVSKSLIDGKADWYWTLNVLDAGVPYLLRLELTVEHSGNHSDAEVQYQMIRLIRDPQVFIDSAAAAESGL